MTVEEMAAVMTILSREGIPLDVQELLIYGDKKRGIKAGTLSRACDAAITEHEKQGYVNLKEVIDRVIKAYNRSFP